MIFNHTINHLWDIIIQISLLEPQLMINHHGFSLLIPIGIIDVKLIEVMNLQKITVYIMEVVIQDHAYVILGLITI